MTDPPVTPGQILAGKYRVERVLGAGAMGVVVAAVQLALNRRVALKFLLPGAKSNQEHEDRFLREARIAAMLRSQHVAAVLDVGVLETGSPFIVMEFLDGSDLASVLEKSGPLPIEDAVTYVLQVCEALAEAHAAGIVHRDLKPANLFLTRTPNGSPCVKVCDFGISKLTGAEMDLTRTGQMMGSPLYMSPEAIGSGKHVDARGDIWALGVILYELLAGQPPFTASEMMHLFKRIMMEPPRPIEEVRPGVPAGLWAAIVRALEKERDRRWPGAREFAAAIAPYAKPCPAEVLPAPVAVTAAVASAPAAVAPRTPAPTRAVPVLVALLVIGVPAALFFGLWLEGARAKAPSTPTASAQVTAAPSAVEAASSASAPEPSATPPPRATVSPPAPLKPMGTAIPPTAAVKPAATGARKSSVPQPRKDPYAQ
jgi:serine/threonine-protein kinase